MIKDIKRLMGRDSNKLVLPVTLSIIDSLLNSCMYGVMLLVFAALADGTFGYDKLKIFFGALIGIFVVRCVLQAIGFTKIQCLGANVSRKLRLKLGNHIRELNLGYFNNNSIGRLNGVLTTDVSDYEAIVTHCLCDIIKVVSFGVLSVGFLFCINWIFALVMLLIVAVSIPFLFKSGKTSKANISLLKSAKSDLVTRIVEYVNGIKTFRLYNLTGETFSALDEDLKKLKKASVKSELSVLPLSMAFYVITAIMVPVAIILGGYLYKTGDIAAAEFVLSLFVTVSLADILGVLSSLYPQIKSITKATENVCEVLEEKAFDYNENITSLNGFDITYEDVSFSYTGSVKVLDGVSFTVKQGTTTALIGPSGSGKTTITSLLSRFWDVSGGCIKINGIDIRDISPDVLTKYMAIVFQDVYLLNDTIMNNIKIGNPKATDEQVYAAAKAACCHEFIEKLENGYETMLGEGGAGLSGGEKQRISIARALLKDAPIILLDETTSNLDADNEKEINLAFKRLMKNKTVLVIAHKLDTIKSADNIIVLKEGKIIEQGNHEELIKNDGWYADVCQEQEKARKWIFPQKVFSL